MELEEAKSFYDLQIGERLGGWRDLVFTYRDKNKDFETKREESLETKIASKDIVLQLNYSVEKTEFGCKCVWAYISADNMKDSDICRHPDYHSEGNH